MDVTNYLGSDLPTYEGTYEDFLREQKEILNSEPPNDEEGWCLESRGIWVEGVFEFQRYWFQAPTRRNSKGIALHAEVLAAAAERAKMAEPYEMDLS